MNRFVEPHLVVVVCAGLAAAVAALVVSLVTAAATRARSRALARLLAETGGEDALARLVEGLDAMESKAARLNNDIRNLQTNQRTCLQHVGLVRFDAFHDVGGKQSFALALLDADSDGVLVTGLFGRDEGRSYAKPIRGGTSEVALTDEEKSALKQALERSGAAR